MRIEECGAVFRSKKASIHASMPEIKAVCTQLSQALKTSAADAVILDMLRRLSIYMYPVRGDRMLEYLRYTGAVPLVKEVRRDYGKEASGFASRLLDSWKAVLVELQNKQKPATASGNLNLTSCGTPRASGKLPRKALSVSSSSSSDSSDSSTEDESEVGRRALKWTVSFAVYLCLAISRSCKQSPQKLHQSVVNCSKL